MRAIALNHSTGGGKDGESSLVMSCHTISSVASGTSPRSVVARPTGRGEWRGRLRAGARLRAYGAGGVGLGVLRPARPDGAARGGQGRTAGRRPAVADAAQFWGSAGLPHRRRGRRGAAFRRDRGQRTAQIGVYQRLAALCHLNRWKVIAGRGIRDLHFPRPVRPGDVLTDSFTIEAIRATRTAGDVVTLVSRLVNQDGDPVLAMTSDVHVTH